MPKLNMHWSLSLIRDDCVKLPNFMQRTIQKSYLWIVKSTYIVGTPPLLSYLRVDEVSERYQKVGVGRKGDVWIFYYVEYKGYS